MAGCGCECVRIPPDPAVLRKVYEDSLARRDRDYGATARRSTDRRPDRVWQMFAAVRDGIRRPRDFRIRRCDAGRSSVAAGGKAGAAKYLRIALAKAEAVFGKDGPHGDALEAQGDLKGAAELYQRSLEIDMKALGASDKQSVSDLLKLTALQHRIAAAVTAGH